MTKKEFNSFNKSIEKLIDSYGGVVKIEHFQTSFKRYSIETKYGLLNISLETDKSKCSIYSLFTRFEEIEKVNVVALEQFSLNRYSGKLNFHDVNPTIIINNFGLLLDTISI